MNTVRSCALVSVFIAVGLASCGAAEEAAPHTRPSVRAYADCASGVAQPARDTIAYCGQINRDAVTAIAAAINTETRTLEITSGGGPSPAAMALGALIQARELKVEVKQFCLSACSTYVLPAASEIIVEEDAIVGFHHTGAYAITLLADRAGAGSDHPSRGLAVAEERYFEQLGIPAGTVYRLAEGVSPQCVAVTSGPHGRQAEIRYLHQWFVPTATEARELFRGRLTGYWPASQKETQALLKGRLGGEPSVQFGWPSTAGAEITRPRQLPDC